MSDDLERFVAQKKYDIGACLRGRLSEFDMPTISDADSLCEQFYDSIGQAVNATFSRPNDGIDWEKLEKDLQAYADEVRAEWQERKRAEDRAEAIRAGRM